MRGTLSLLVLFMSGTGHAESQNPVEILDEVALAFIDPAAPLTVVADGFRWTEGPLWIQDGGYLLFSDIPNNVVFKYGPQTGVEPYLEPSGGTGRYPGDDAVGSNGLLLDQRGRLVLMQHGDRRVAVMDAPLSSPAASYVTLADRYRGKRLNSPNDGVFHSDGSLYFTDPPYGLKDLLDDERKALPFQGIYRLGTGGDLELLDDSVSFPNGIGLSTGEKTLYVAVSDRESPMWLAYDLQSDGTLAGRRVFYDAGHLVGIEGEQGLPDGMVVHSSGVIFAAGPGGVWLFTPDARVLAKIRTGRLTANCELSADERMLFITAQDTLMTILLKAR